VLVASIERRARPTTGRVDLGAVIVESPAEAAAVRARERGEPEALALRLERREAKAGGGMTEEKKLARIVRLVADYERGCPAARSQLTRESYARLRQVVGGVTPL
jgi:hypothetical protein